MPSTVEDSGAEELETAIQESLRGAPSCFFPRILGPQPWVASEGLFQVLVSGTGVNAGLCLGLF